MDNFDELGVVELGLLVDGVNFLFLADVDKGLFIPWSTSDSGSCFL